MLGVLVGLLTCCLGAWAKMSPSLGRTGLSSLGKKGRWKRGDRLLLLLPCYLLFRGPPSRLARRELILLPCGPQAVGSTPAPKAPVRRVQA